MKKFEDFIKTLESDQGLEIDADYIKFRIAMIRRELTAQVEEMLQEEFCLDNPEEFVHLVMGESDSSEFDGMPDSLPI